MMRSRRIVPTLALALAVGACGGDPSGKALDASTQKQAAKGTGLVLDSVTGLTLPLIGKLGDVVIDQAVITNFALVETTVGQIVGLEVDGVLQLTGGVLGTDVITENFTTTASVTSSGPGQCNLVTIDLGQISIGAPLGASVKVPAATLTAKGSGAVGSLLCNLGNLLGGLTSGTGAPAGAGGIVNALNNLI